MIALSRGITSPAKERVRHRHAVPLSWRETNTPLAVAKAYSDLEIVISKEFIEKLAGVFAARDYHSGISSTRTCAAAATAARA
jgi:hypothetical protein